MNRAARFMFHASRNRWICCLVLFLLMSVSAFGTIEIESIQFGFASPDKQDGYYKRNRWVPLHVLAVSRDEPEIFIGEILVEVNDVLSGRRIQTYSTRLVLMPTDRQRPVLYIFQPNTPIKLSLKLIHQDGHVQISRELIPQLPKQARDLLLLALTPGRGVLSRWDGEPIDEKGEGHMFVTFLGGQKYLPTHWKGYDAVDLFVIRGVALTERYIYRRQQTALLDWIHEGGTLIVSGGSDLRYLRNSFLEPFLPITLGELKTVAELPNAMRRFGFKVDSAFNVIDFTRRGSSRILIGDADVVYIANRVFGNGQIICMAFDYNAHPFAQSPGHDKFWAWMLKTVGRSPRRLEALYDRSRKHHEKIQALLSSVSSTRAPLIRGLAIFLLLYLLSFGGFTVWAGKRQDRLGKYWIAGFLITLFFSCVVILSRYFVPSSVSMNRLSVCSVYPERGRAHLQSYLGMISSAHTRTSIRFNSGTFIKPLIPKESLPLHLVESKETRLRQATLDAWFTSTYVVESFADFPDKAPEYEEDAGEKWIRHHLPNALENAWFIDGDGYAYLGAVQPNDRVKIKERSTTSKMPPFSQELSGTRQKFAQILSGEVVLRYLVREDVPKLVGWVRQSLLPMELNHLVNADDETFMILYLAKTVEKR